MNKNFINLGDGNSALWHGGLHGRAELQASPVRSSHKLPCRTRNDAPTEDRWNFLAVLPADRGSLSKRDSPIGLAHTAALEELPSRQAILKFSPTCSSEPL
jgi:hypothetical protein